MATFADGDLERLDFRLLQNGPIVLYWRRTVLEKDRDWLLAHSYSTVEFDCSGWANRATFYDDLARRLRFPDYFGRNLDALNDCLSDIEVPIKGGLALQFTRFDQFFRNLPDVSSSFLDILAHAARMHLLFGRRVISMLQSDDPTLVLPSVGATPVSWNPREWISKERVP